MFDGLTMREIAKLRPAVFEMRLSEHDLGMHPLPTQYCPACYFPGPDGLHNPDTGAVPVYVDLYVDLYVELRACPRH